jgi:hypothetical protein
MVPKKMAYSQLFLNLRGKIRPENHCFRPVFELRHSLIRQGSLPGCVAKKDIALI